MAKKTKLAAQRRAAQKAARAQKQAAAQRAVAEAAREAAVTTLTARLGRQTAAFRAAGNRPAPSRAEVERRLAALAAAKAAGQLAA